MELGLRVVRGPDWKWADQDAGEGHVGTVVEIGKINSQTIPYKTVVIQWDSGSRSNYRVGYQNAYDLRVFDNAPCGSFHPNTRCQSCNCDSIIGMRWQCSVCPNYDLCTSCYMSGYHCTEHPFIRYDTAESPGVELPPRFFNNTVRIEARGIFKGARVVRGHDWDWENQDGGLGKVGEVIEIRGWDKSSRRSVASVRWQKNNANVYRVGHKGKVDLKCVFDASGGYYFRDHLPILGQMANRLDQKQSETSTETAMPEASSISSHLSQRISSSSVMMPETSSLFSVGDRVQVIAVDENILKEMQRGHGGWNPRMAQVIGWVGTVHRITDNQDVRVQFENSNRWTFNPKALGKFTRYTLGETVQLLDDEEQVRRLQKNHGEWIEYMRPSLGKIGKITKIYTDGDLRVAVDGKTWTLNPLSVKRPNAELSNDSAMKETKNQDGMQWGLSNSMTPKIYPRNSRKSKSNKSGTAELNQSGCSSSENNNQVNTDANINESIDIALQSKGISQDAKCLICDDNIANLLFFPCLHQVCCSECSYRLKKCFSCKQVIQKLIFIDPLSSEVLNVVDEWPMYSPVSSGSALPSTRNSNEDSNLEPINNLHEDVHERLKFLETKIMEIEEANSCGICLEKPKNTIFLCGHGACTPCANTLTTCHMCRKTIVRKINIY